MDKNINCFGWIDCCVNEAWMDKKINCFGWIDGCVNEAWIDENKENEYMDGHALQLVRHEWNGWF